MNQYTELSATRSHDGAKIILRAQNQEDLAKLVKVCPRDQRIPLVAGWSEDGMTLCIEPAPEANAPTAAAVDLAGERKRLLAMDVKDLKTYAAEKNFHYANNASKEKNVSGLLAHLYPPNREGDAPETQPPPDA